jgi:hypothetical protein
MPFLIMPGGNLMLWDLGFGEEVTAIALHNQRL